MAGHITSVFGQRKHPLTGKLRNHNGVDISAKVGTPVMATGSGTVIAADWQKKDHSKGLGRRVMIDHGNGNTSNVGHLSEILVKKGDKVRKGQILGKSGNSGASEAPHVHYEERHNGKPHPPTFDPGSFKPELANPTPRKP